MRPVIGSVVIPAGVTLGANDTLPLFYMSSGSAAHICDFLLDSGALDAGTTLTMSLLDSTTPTPTTVISASTVFRAGGLLTNSNATHGTILGAVNYTAPNLIFLRAIAGGTGALAAAGTLFFMFEVARD
jgi:hypothetical protein